ncbi:rod shape-determining protein MreD [Treponema sp.]
MKKTVFWSTAIAAIAALLQSTLLSHLAIFNVVPDLALGVLVYTAYVNGTMTGQLSGFSSGLALDFISAAPLGFNALMRTIIGALFGLIKGTFFLDIIILPMALTASATLLKALLAAFLHFLFAGALPAYDFFASTLWIEIGFNALSSPFLFAFLKLFKTVLLPRKAS